MKKILHLNSYYIDNHLYSYLYKNLDDKCKQEVFIPIKQDRNPENEIELAHANFHFRKIIQKYHKFHFWGRTKLFLKEVEKAVSLKDMDFVHAHNLFNDGALAYELKKKYGLAYIVAVRSTDTGLQYRLMKHRRPYIHKVLQNAEKIIFISEHYKDVLLEMMPKKIANQLKPKMIVIPNGIDKFWHDNIYKKPTLINDKSLNLIYVGQIIPRKNVNLILEACKHLIEKKSYTISFKIVGGKHVNHTEYYEDFLQRLPNYPFAEYVGQIRDKQELMNAYRAADIFVMPSINELFGLVYIEAISQGLRIIYAQKSGISPFMEDKKMGEPVDLSKEDSIGMAIEKITTNYNSYSIEPDIFDNFDWNKISNTYLSLYNS